MNDTSITEMALDAMLLTAKLGAPVLLTAMAIGLLIGMIQSATQLQEATITFVPKLFGVGLVILLCGNWMLNSAVSYTHELFNSLPGLLR
ncbi:MAG: flagellar biosynthetic protein FliQ [Microthrixaceae bacterium]|nr:flagellar biosynthetic protein FliQ [Microthrixaceae bacterium]